MSTMNEESSGPVPGKKTRKLRKFLIDPKFQISIMAYFIFISLITIGAIYVSTRMTWNSLANSPLLTRLVGPQFLKELLDEQRDTLTSVFLIASGEALLILLVGGMVISHRVAGPIYRIRKSLDAIADGEPPKPLKFRKNDYLLDVQDSYNRAVEKLNEGKS